MSKNKQRIGLLGRIVLAIALGIGCGFFFPDVLCRTFATFNAIFSSFLNFIIPLLILGFVAPAIADIGARAGKMLIITVAIAFAMTFCAGMISYFISAETFPSLIGDTVYTDISTASGAPVPFFELPMPPLMGVTSALVLAFVLGFGCASLPDSTERLKGILDDFCALIRLIINKAIVPLLPLYIFGIFLSMTVEGAVAPVLMTFIKIIVVIFVLHVGILMLQYLIASIFSRRNPFKALWTMMPAYMTALGTQSSAATIPVTLERTVTMGVSRDTAGFVIPLCATIHMSGSTLKIVACAVALMIVKGIPFDTVTMMGFVAMLGVTIVAAPGVPGGAIMASLGLLTGILGFSDSDNAMMIALYIAMDSFGTACNITGDGAIAQIIDTIFPPRQPDAA